MRLTWPILFLQRFFLNAVSNLAEFNYFLLDENNALLDHAVVLYFSAPASYTGESVLEIQAHGGPVLLKLILRAALTKLAFCGLRIAEPGEFTKRAFLNGRMDLTQAEAVSGLIDAASEAVAHVAARSLSGDFSREVHAAGDLLDEARALSEASLDFPEEDLKEKQIFTRAREAQIKLGTSCKCTPWGSSS